MAGDGPRCIAPLDPSRVNQHYGITRELYCLAVNLRDPEVKCVIASNHYRTVARLVSEP